MKHEYWVKAAEEIANDISNGADGVVIAHGTDTMHYTAAALSFMLKTPVPIIITGAQRSSDRPSSDANINLIDSVIAAKSDIAEVCVCMHGSLNDEYTYLHKGTKVRKMHTSRRDTFRSINAQPIAKIQNKKSTSTQNMSTPKGETMNLKSTQLLKRKSDSLKVSRASHLIILNITLIKDIKALLLKEPVSDMFQMN